MSESENTQLARTLFDNFNAHNLKLNEPYENADIKTDAPGAPGMTSRDASQAYTQSFITAFPDLHFDISMIVAQGDHVVVHWVGTGTHSGPLTAPSGDPIPPTGKKAVVPGSTTFEIKGGKVTRQWILWDRVSFLGQLGLLPMM